MHTSPARILLLAFLLLAATSCGLRNKHRRGQNDDTPQTEVTPGSSERYIPLAYNERGAMRAVWLTTIYGLDWPETAATSASRMKAQRESLCRILDRLAKDNFNTVFLQVRLRGDVLYPSNIEPFSSILTGTRRIRPNYDPLKFAIRECHKRGLSLHAWIVTLPLGTDKQVRSLAPEGIRNQHPEWCVKHNGEWYLNPAIPAARTYIASLAAELASRYNIDGIHLDYIRYPENNARFLDDKQFRATGRSKSNKADWRTDNISKLVKEVADSARAHNPYILMSVATLGRYREIPGRKVSGWTCRGAVFQDPLAWFRQGSVDFIVPMMYHDGDLFYPFLNDWRALFGDYPVIPGLAAYRIAEKKSRWSVETIAQQMSAIEQIGCAGVAFYRESNIRPFIKGMPELFEQHFPTPVRPLAFHKKSAPVPPQPTLLRPVLQGNELHLRWTVPNANSLRYNLFFNIYDAKGHPGPDALLYPSLYSNECVVPLYLFPKNATIHFRVEATTPLGIVGRASAPVLLNLRTLRNR